MKLEDIKVGLVFEAYPDDGHVWSSMVYAVRPDHISAIVVASDYNTTDYIGFTFSAMYEPFLDGFDRGRTDVVGYVNTIHCTQDPNSNFTTPCTFKVEGEPHQYSVNLSDSTIWSWETVGLVKSRNTGTTTWTITFVDRDQKTIEDPTMGLL